LESLFQLHVVIDGTQHEVTNNHVLNSCQPNKQVGFIYLSLPHGTCHTKIALPKSASKKQPKGGHCKKRLPKTERFQKWSNNTHFFRSSLNLNDQFLKNLKNMFNVYTFMKKVSYEGKAQKNFLSRRTRNGQNLLKIVTL